MIKTINQLFQGVLNITAIGHHHLKRHQVYEVELKNQTVVIKFYFKKNRFESELNALTLLRDIIPVPKVIKSGVIEGIEYLVMEKIDGVTMDSLDLRLEEKQSLIEAAGQMLKKINTVSVDLPYGRLQESSTFVSYQDYLDDEMFKIIHALDQFDHPQPEIIEKGIIKLKNNCCISQVNKALCHLDFSERNIMIKQSNGRYEISAIIDFEQAGINDLARELTLVEDRMLDDHTRAFFYKGYGQAVPIPDVYFLFYGLIICAWSLPVDEVFYNIGLNLVKRYL